MPTRRFHIPIALFERYKKQLNMTHATLAAELGISEVSSKRISSTGDAPEQTAKMLAALIVINRHPKVLLEYRTVLSGFTGGMIEPPPVPKRIAKKPLDTTMENPPPASQRRVFRGLSAKK